MFTETVRLTDKPTHHFFVVDATTFVPILVDDDGTILVFTDREKAQVEGHKRFGQHNVLATVGMGDEKWAMFQSREKYRIVE